MLPETSDCNLITNDPQMALAEKSLIILLNRFSYRMLADILYAGERRR